MAFKKATQILTWSYSRLKMWKQCPLKAKLTHIDKLAPITEENKSPALVWGDTVHKHAEYYIKGVTTTVPTELKPWTKLLKDIRQSLDTEKLTSSEINQCFTKTWDTCGSRDWDNIWLRVKTDATWVDRATKKVTVVDWKTGRYDPRYKIAEYTEQIELYALTAVLNLLPHLGPDMRVEPMLVFVDAKEVYPPEGQPLIYTPADVDRLKAKWSKEVKPMLADKRFAPKPGRLCEYCDFRRTEGTGDCRFG